MIIETTNYINLYNDKQQLVDCYDADSNKLISHTEYYNNGNIKKLVTSDSIIHNNKYGKSIEYYDKLKNLTTFTYYNDIGLKIKTQTENDKNELVEYREYEYDSFGREISVKTYNEEKKIKSSVSNIYNLKGLISLTIYTDYNQEDGLELQKIKVYKDYDKDDNVTLINTVATKKGSIFETKTEYRYDDSGNKISEYSSDGLYDLRYVYDKDNNLIGKIDSILQEKEKYVYDSSNSIAMVIALDHTINYIYDAYGNIKKKITVKF